jgi:N4-gp56 family major capsid protein
MTQNIQTISARASNYVTRKLLEVAEYRDIYGVIGTSPVPRKDKLPMNASKTVQWRRYEHLPLISAPTAEGVTPDSSTVTVTDLTQALTQFVGYVVLSDLSIETTEDPQLSIWGERQGDQAVRSMTKVREGVLMGGTSITYSNGSARNQLNTTITKASITITERTLALAMARRLTKLLTASQGYNTTPIPASYFAVCSTWVKYDLENTIGETNGWKPIEKYSNQAGVPGEFGSLGRVRFIEHEEMTFFPDAGTTKGSGHKSTGGTLEDVFATLVFGEESFGITMFGGYNGKGKGYDGIQGIVKPLGSGGTEDPANQRATVAWKTMQATKRLNEAWMYRIESGATA